jgi:hypothetical protein
VEKLQEGDGEKSLLGGGITFRRLAVYEGWLVDGWPAADDFCTNILPEIFISNNICLKEFEKILS